VAGTRGKVIILIMLLLVMLLLKATPILQILDRR
jgi:hypothetical protein